MKGSNAVDDSVATATENANRLDHKHVCVNYLHVASHDYQYQEVIQHTHTHIHTLAHSLTESFYFFSQYLDCVTLNCYRDALIKIQLDVLPINSLDTLKMTGKSCVTFIKFRWRMNFTSPVCACYITGLGQNILILTCARKILSHNCFVAIHKKNAGSLLHLLFTPSNRPLSLRFLRMRNGLACEICRK